MLYNCYWPICVCGVPQANLGTLCMCLCVHIHISVCTHTHVCVYTYTHALQQLHYLHWPICVDGVPQAKLETLSISTLKLPASTVTSVCILEWVVLYHRVLQASSGVYNRHSAVSLSVQLHHHKHKLVCAQHKHIFVCAYRCITTCSIKHAKKRLRHKGKDHQSPYKKKKGTVLHACVYVYMYACMHVHVCMCT